MSGWNRQSAAGFDPQIVDDVGQVAVNNGLIDVDMIMDADGIDSVATGLVFTTARQQLDAVQIDRIQIADKVIPSQHNAIGSN